MRNSAHIIGVSVSASTIEITIVIDSVTANSRNNRPTMPPSSRIGRNTAISDSVIDSTVKPTSRDPSSAASSRPIPFSMCREMFSITTIASSTTNPVATVSAISDRLSSENPSSHIGPNVAMIDAGTTIDGMIVARQLRRNRNVTSVTRNTAITSVRSVSASDARIATDRFAATVSASSAGSSERRSGSSAEIWSMVLTMFAPGVGKITSTTAGTPPSIPAWRRSSVLSSTLATSDSFTGEPFW